MKFIPATIRKFLDVYDPSPPLVSHDESGPGEGVPQDLRQGSEESHSSMVAQTGSPGQDLLMADDSSATEGSIISGEFNKKSLY